jgi:hypothetical protein
MGQGQEPAQRFARSLREQYGFDAWSDAAAPHLAASRLAFGPLPSAQKSSNFTLERRVELPEGRLGFHAYIEYYRSTSDEETRFAVTILQNQTVQQAHEELVEELSKFISPSLPRAEEKDIHVGHIAFAGHGTIQTAVKFVRGNLFVKVESIGTRQADVKELAEAIDKEMLSHPGV